MENLLKTADNSEKCQFVVTHLINTIDNFGNDDSVVFRCLKVLYACLELAHDKYLSYAQSFIPEIETISLLYFGGSKSKHRKEVHLLANSIYNHLVSNTQLVLPSAVGLEKVIPNPLKVVSKEQQKDLSFNMSEDLIEWNENPQKQAKSTDLLELDDSQFLSGLIYPNFDDLRAKPPSSTVNTLDQFPFNQNFNKAVNSTNNVDDLIQFSPPKNMSPITSPTCNSDTGFAKLPAGNPRQKVDFELISLEPQNKPLVEFSPIDHGDFMFGQQQGNPKVEFSPIDGRDFILSQTQPEFEPISPQYNQDPQLYDEFEPITPIEGADFSVINNSNEDSEIKDRGIFIDQNNDEMFEPISNSPHICDVSHRRENSGSDLFEPISENNSPKIQSPIELFSPVKTKTDQKINKRNSDMFEPISVPQNEMFEPIDDQQLIDLPMLDATNTNNGNNLNLERTPEKNTNNNQNTDSNNIVFDLI
ncbi:hypothetical protein GPJ56_000485 [Histomonas meleagridis]|uniref:uncharacterized protein n=1 Tax=Histomonas meleagridis TaxID=135588 RepID=UPI003559FE80|nr:hypothetical protein GPJ56_000485 [Histomonas meleagridis]KAH0796476.1 hypothetical protein GO595_010369 [Histomonas meleagridis]